MDAVQQEIDSLERRLESLAPKLSDAKEAVRSWVEAGSNLSISAAEARAKNQGAGRGIAGALLGAKFRSAMRLGAAASNAAIAKEVARKRAAIADGKANAQRAVKEVQGLISDAKVRLRELKALQRTTRSVTKERRTTTAKSVNLLHKLKEAKDLGLLTDAEYEQKRRKIVDGI